MIKQAHHSNQTTDNMAAYQQAFLIMQEMLRREAQTSLIQFCQLVNPRYKPFPIHYLIADRLEQLAEGNIQRLMIFVPPRVGKSELGSRCFPPWFLGRFAGSNVIMASYASSLVESLSRSARRAVTSEFFGETFDAFLAENGNTVACWSIEHANNAISSLLATSVGGSVTGYGFDVGIIDDPVKSRKEAESETVREYTWQWYLDDFYSRADSPDSRLLVIQTRWHEDDLSGRLLRVDAETEDPTLRENWVVLSLPAIAEKDEEYYIHNPLYQEALGDTHFRRREGESIHPEKYPIQRLRRIEALSPRGFRSLYQQRPTADEGDIYRKEWWKRFDPSFISVDPLLNIISWDTSQTVSETADFSVGLHMKFDGTDTYIPRRWKYKLIYPSLKALIVETYEMHHPDFVLVEYKSSGISLVQDIQKDHPEIPIIGVPVTDGSKEARAIAVSDFVQSGRVHLPQADKNNQNDPELWAEDFISEMAKFPNGAHDDDVDSFSQGMKFIQTAIAESYFLPYLTGSRAVTPLRPPKHFYIIRALYMPPRPKDNYFYALWAAVINDHNPSDQTGTFLSMITAQNQPSIYVFAELTADLSTKSEPLPAISNIIARIKDTDKQWKVTPQITVCNADMFSAAGLSSMPLLYLFTNGDMPVIPSALDVPSALAATRDMFVGDGLSPAIVVSKDCINLWRSLKGIKSDPAKIDESPMPTPAKALALLCATFAKQSTPEVIEPLPEDYEEKQSLKQMFDDIFSK